jgi:hypothetical protein
MSGTHLNPINIIDPNKFSSEELLKMVYRDVQTINVKIDVIQRDYAEDKKTLEERISTQGMSIVELKTIISEKEKHFKNSLTITAIGLSVLSVLSGLIGWLLTHTN